MKRWLLTGTILCALPGAWFLFSRESNNRERAISFHTEGWHLAARKAGSSASKPFFAFFDSRSPSAYYRDAMKAHEQALLEIGYLTNCVIRLTNQVTTREFSSNFFGQLRTRVGTNTDQVWLCRYLPNRDGIAPTLPVKDLPEWERIFRECAVKYASNFPPSLSTNGSVP